MPRNRQNAQRDPRTGRFVSRGRAGTSLVPRPDYSGVRVTGGTSVTPRDPGWRYGGPDWRPGGQQQGPRPADAARQARRAGPGPGTSVEPRRAGTSAQPHGTRSQVTARQGTSLVPANPQQAASPRPSGLARAGRLAGRASGPIGAGLLGTQLGGAVGTAAQERSPGFANMIRNLSETPVLGEVLGRTGALMSGDFGSAFQRQPLDTPDASYSSREREAEEQLLQARRSQRSSQEPSREDLLRGRGGMPAPMTGASHRQMLEDRERQLQQEQMGSWEDPFQEFLQQQIQELSGAYDAQIDAIGGLGDVFGQQAAEAQGNIGDFFGHAGDVARAGIPVTQDIYDTASENVGGIYDDLGGRLESMPQRLTDIATDAAGGQVSGSVAGRVAEATAPFAAAGESARAGATSNLAQHSAAGQNYLNQLASATGSEGALHQSNVEQALNQQQQLIAHRQAELEGAKQRALMEVTADVAGASSENMANMALAQALGLDHLPGQVDPMQYLQAQGMMSDLAGDQGPMSLEDQISLERDMIGLQRDQTNLEQSLNPQFHRDQVMQNLSMPAQQIMPAILEATEGIPVNDETERLDLMLRELDTLAEEGGLDLGSMTQSGLAGGQAGVESELRDAIRRLANL